MIHENYIVTHTLKNGEQRSSMTDYMVPVMDETKAFYISLAMYVKNKHKDKTA